MLAFVGIFFISCSNVDELENTIPPINNVENEMNLSKVTCQGNNAAMEKFMSNVDQLNQKYANPTACNGFFMTWTRNFLSAIVDSSIGAVGAAVSWGVGFIAGTVASGLYNQYMDYATKEMEKTDQSESETIFPPDFSKPLDVSSLKGVKFNKETTTIILRDSTQQSTYIDSVGWLHNQLLEKLKEKGNKYVDDNGTMDYDGISYDTKRISLFMSTESNLLISDSTTTGNKQNNDPEIVHAALRSFTESFIKHFNPVTGGICIDFATSFEASRSNTLDLLNIDKSVFDGIRDFGQKIFVATSDLSITEKVLYCKELDTIIDESELNSSNKEQFKTLNNIFINSNLYWKNQ